ncbi:MAG TPA: guanine deaminase [Polyangiaceae bacterium]|jgi:guanine deaminase|nr:guanine deaminase [Polyangiaceae bacterium]
MVAWALRGRILTPTERGKIRFFDDGVIVVDARGRIEAVGDRQSTHVPGVLYDVHPNLVIPGFVDAHVHYPQTRIIGRATGPLLRWLNKSVFPEEARFRDADYARVVAEEFIDRMLAVGTTSAAIFSSSSAVATEVLFERLAERGMRGVVGLTLMDRRAPKALAVERKRALRDADRLVARWHEHDGRLRFAVTPRFALSCSRALLRDAGSLASAQALPVQTHISENESECAATLEAHAYARDYLDVYERAGLVGPRTILAHAVHLSAREWKRLHRAEASVAHCPDSNFFLGSGRMPLARARVGKLALGSDVAAGRSFSMRRAMASAYDNALCVNETITPAELFRLATLEGARALGFSAQSGSLEPGKDADLVVLRAAADAQNAADLLSGLIFDGDDLAVLACYVRGRRLDQVAPGPRER